MEFLGYIRPDGSVGIRNYICLLAADACSDPVCKRVAAAVRGAVAIPYQSVADAGGMEKEALQSLLLGTAINPNVGAVIIIDSSTSDHLYARLLANEVAKTGRLVEVVNISHYGGVVGAFAKALSLAITMARDITTYRRELVKLTKLKTGFWLGENNSLNLNLAIEKCCSQLTDHDCVIIGNPGLYRALGKVVGSGEEEQDSSGFIRSFAKATTSGLTFLSTKSKAMFKAMAVAASVQILVVTVQEGHIPDHPLVPAIRITSDSHYYQKMMDTVELDLGAVCGCDPDPAGTGLLVLNEILATCSGKLSKCEVINESAF